MLSAKQNICKGDTMSQSNNTLELRRNKHLTLKERYKIEVLLKEDLRPP